MSLRRPAEGNSSLKAWDGATGPVALVNPFRFSTKHCDDETGLYYYGHRYYHPHTGRWLSRDPIGEGGGLNLYGLVNNQPVHFVDPHGLWGIKIGRVHLGWGEPTYVFDREVWQEIKERWHTGLDAIGVIEPTPLADGLNALLYAMEGGWGNAGISAVGMVPFLGDGAKLCKYVGNYGAKLSETAERALKLPATDASLIGTTKLGYTTPQGKVFLRPGLTHAEQAYVLRHEGIQVFFTPKGGGALATFRQNLGQFAYDNSQLLRFAEEAIAETRASGSLLQGLRHPLVNPYGITPGGLLLESGLVGGGLFVAGYLGYEWGGGN
ncbi:hypothetical protein NXS98_04725 [Fontisphaera persica]|nr:RHS repeat-associated core domain-containing protein [Fontisphaera persica]WCJ60440.1 hypothetical protein NXS98_04725 [Fontisphaera persica]